MEPHVRIYGLRVCVLVYQLQAPHDINKMCHVLTPLHTTTIPDEPDVVVYLRDGGHWQQDWPEKRYR